MRPRNSFLPWFLGALTLGGAASAQTTDQTIEILSREGDPVIGLGVIQTIQNLVINNEGGWLALADTDANAQIDYAVLRQGFPAIGEGDPVADPAGATVKALNNSNWRYDDASNILWSFKIDGNALNDVCLYWNTRLLARERISLGAPADQILPDAEYKAFDSFDFVTPNKVLAFCELFADPLAPNAQDDAVVEITIDDLGFVLETNLLIFEGQQFPVDLDPSDNDDMTFKSFHSTPKFHSMGVNRHGDFIWGAETDGPENSKYMLIGLHTIVAREGQVFSAPGNPNLDGRTLANFTQFEADLNDLGDWVHTAGLNGPANDPLADTNAVLMVNGEVYVQEGDSLASLNGATLGNSTAAPVYITNSRDVFWVADLRNTLGSEDVAYMRNKEVIIREGQDFVGEFLVTILRTAVNAFSVSDDGRFWVGEVVLQGGIDAVIMTDFGLALELPGCVGNPGTMRKRSGTVRSGDTLTLEMSNGQAPGVATAILISGREPLGGECGAMTPFGELFAVAPYAFVGFGPPWVGPPALIQLNIPNNISLVDTEWYAQGLLIDIAGTLPEEDLRLTNGMRLEIGAP